MKHILLPVCIIFWLSPIVSVAKKLPGHDEWNSGMLVLNNQQILKGKIYYNAEHDLVQILLDNQIKTFSPYNVDYFQFFDETREIKRSYAALKNHSKKHKRRGITFYEVLLDGDMVLLRKELMYYVNSYEILYNSIDLVPSTASEHYVLVQGDLVSFNSFQKDILPLMSSHEEDVDFYILNNKMNVDDFVNQILIIDYFNSLKDPSYKLLENQTLVKE